MMVEGDVAPDFSLVGIESGEKRQFSLAEATDAGNYVVLFFYPADFSPVCTPEMCAIRDAEFFEFTDNVLPWAISGDTTYAHRAFADQYGLDFPLLSDTNHDVAEQFDVRYDEWEGHRSITKRGVFLINPDRRISYVWRSDDAYVEPDLWPLKLAIDRAIADGNIDAEVDSDDLKPDYDAVEIERLE